MADLDIDTREVAVAHELVELRLGVTSDSHICAGRTLSPVFHVTISSAPDPSIQVGSTYRCLYSSAAIQSRRSRTPTASAGVDPGDHGAMRPGGCAEHRPQSLLQFE
jgi:hypothetical protein